MALTFTVRPGYTFSSGEKVTYSKLNLLGSPRVEGSGTLGESDIADGSVSTQKLKSMININSKIDDHNIALTKLAEGTHGQVLYYNTDGDLTTLAPGTDGYFLQTRGAGVDPQWAAQAGDDTIAISRLVTSGANKYISTDADGEIQWEDKATTLTSSFGEYFSATTTDTLGTIITSGDDSAGARIVNFAHGFAAMPRLVRVVAVCTADDTANTGYALNDELEGHNLYYWNTSYNFPAFATTSDTANINIRFEDSIASTGSRMGIQNKSSHDIIAMPSASMSNWKLKVYAWK